MRFLALRVAFVCALLLAVVGSSPNIASAESQNPAKAFMTGVSCVAANDCEAVGSFVNNAGFFVPLAEGWNGTVWEPQPAPVPSGPGYILFRGVSCYSATFCEAVGEHQASATTSTLAEVWNGATWAIQPTPNVGSQDLLFGVACLSVTFCEAVGTGGTGSSLAEVWDGTAWTIQPTPNPVGVGVGGGELHGVSCVSIGFCEAVGQTGASGVPLAEAWNGSSWVLQSAPTPPGATGYARLEGVSCVSASDCEAVGDGYGVVNVVEAWNGTSWATQPGPNIQLFGVSCVSAAACEAVGPFGAAEAWDGTSWTVQPLPSPSADAVIGLNGVSCLSATDCEAAGTADHKSQHERSGVLFEGWNGTVWTLR